MHIEDLQDTSVDFESLDESRKFGRRTFMMGALATGAAVSGPVNYAAWARGRRVPFAKDGRFPLGVAAGFPRPKGITLWTQLDGIKKTQKVRVLIAKDKKFGNVVQEKLVNARSDRGFTARTFVKGLDPHEEYYYRFVTEHSKSMVGRFRTAPPLKSKQKVRVAFYSCQHYEAGFYNVQRAIANEDVDVVVCLGDYIYEYSDGAGGVRTDTSGNNKDGDTQLLEEYRQKYHVYKSDPDLKAMHAAHAFVCVWDDHEVEDNQNGSQGPSSAQSDPNKTNLKNLPRRVSYEQRRANAYKAFFNYHPRMRFKGDRNRIYEDYRIGGLVDLVVTDERQYRDPQPCNDEQLNLAGCPTAESPRTLLGARQKDWFLRTLESSPATWKLWCNELVVMALRVLPGIPAQVDAWDGYAFERQQILDYIIDKNIQNVAAITGDIHTFFAGTAYTTGDQSDGRAAIPEFVGGSATSSGLSESTGLPPATLAGLASFNPHIDFYNFEKKGYGVVEASATELRCELKAVDAKTPGASTASTIASYRVPSGARIPQRLS